MVLELIMQAVPVQRGPQGEHQSYLTSLQFGDIARLLEDGRLYVPNEPELPDFAQRKPNPTRIKSIVHYILETYPAGMTFFPPICMNVQPMPNYREGKLFLPYHDATLRLTDGQHRCLAIKQALLDARNQEAMNQKVIAELEIGVLIYASLPLEAERQAFRDQNLLAQRPGTSLSHMFDQRAPAVLVAKAVMEQVPQFQNNIEMVENGLGKHNPKLLSFSTLVLATQHMYPNLKSREDLNDYQVWATQFWKVVAMRLPEKPWRVMTIEERRQQRQVSIISASIVFQALGLLAHDFLKEQVSMDSLPLWLAALGAVDWRRDNPLWLEKSILQQGAQAELIVSNTRSTVNALHRVLREFVGVTPATGLV